MDKSQNTKDHTQKQPESQETADKQPRPVEIGGRKGPDPTRFGDWEMNGKCVDF